MSQVFRPSALQALSECIHFENDTERTGVDPAVAAGTVTHELIADFLTSVKDNEYF